MQRFMVAYKTGMTFLLQVFCVVLLCGRRVRVLFCSLSLSLSLFSISMKVLKKVDRSVVCCRGVSVFAGPINREMRHLISSLQNHSHQLKGEVLRYKRKLREAQSDLSKVTAGNARKEGKGLGEGEMLSPLPGTPTFLICCAGCSEIFCGTLQSAASFDQTNALPL